MSQEASALKYWHDQIAALQRQIDELRKVVEELSKAKE